MSAITDAFICSLAATMSASTVERLGHQVVAEQDGERLVTDVAPGDADRVTEPLRFGLPHIVDVGQLGDVAHLGLLALTPGLRQVELELERPIEVVLEGALAAAGDDEDVGDAGPDRLLDDVLDRRLVDERQHLLGLRFGRRKETSAEPRRRDDRLPHHRLTIPRTDTAAARWAGSLSTRNC